MRLSVTHLTTYRFSAPMRSVVQSHRLTPLSSGSQRVLHWTVDVPGATRGAEFRDGAGNFIQTVSMLGPVETMRIEVAGLVETENLMGVLRGHRESVPPLAYLRTTRPTHPDRALSDLAHDAVAAIAEDAMLERAHALCDAVADAIAYVPGRTDEATTAAEALARGEGVCQDHTHALISAASAVSVPARYVAGYLWSESDLRQSQLQDGSGHVQSQSAATQAEQQDAPLASPEASHAWAELWVDGLGWVGFDAANRCCPDDRYVRLGSGFNAVDAAPIRGVAQGVGEEHLDVHVSVQQTQS